jgi:hypothetical protein
VFFRAARVWSQLRPFRIFTGQWHWGRFSLNTSVSPATSRSAEYSHVHYSCYHGNYIISLNKRELAGWFCNVIQKYYPFKQVGRGDLNIIQMNFRSGNVKLLSRIRRVAWLIRRVLDLMIEFIGPLYNWLQHFINHYLTLSSSDWTLHGKCSGFQLNSVVLLYALPILLTVPS